MGKPKKDHHPVSFRMAAEVYDRLNQFCQDSGMGKTAAVEHALTKYIDRYYQKEELMRKKEQKNKSSQE